MKESDYDNENIFEKYSQMDRSKRGLEGAGEWQTLKKLLPDFQGKKVLDLGCGYGWHCIYALEQGASSVVGVDLSEKMLEVAKKQTTSKKVEYIHSDIEDISFAENTFDIVLSSLTLHYIESFSDIAKNVHRYLKGDGVFVYSVEHPIFTSDGNQDWIYSEDGSIAHFPVDNYFYEGKRATNFLGENVTKYHKTLTTYVDGLLKNGFHINRIVEPMPPENMINVPGMKDELRRPMMFIVSATNEK
ncbi:MAG: class I SAM-dependent methyltransferase [Bacillota bacterium]